tara:strand:+ start:39 stop:530 length:492 start_codon:yes stop_codon:yes gene_type:complete
MNFKLKITSSIFLISFLVAHSPEIGVQAPDFNLQDQDGKFHSLADYKGKKLVLYFFPRANTPPCKKQACGLRDKYDAFEKSNISILGISFDPEKRLKGFKEKHSIDFNFLSDTKKETAKSYGVNKFFFTSRKTFLIDENGVLIKKIDSVDVGTHADEILLLFN